MQAVAVGGYFYFHAAAIGGWGLVSCIFHCESEDWQFVAGWGIEHHCFAIFVDEGIGEGVEGQITRDGQCCHEFRATYKRVCIGVSIGAFREIAVERVDDGVLFLFVGAHTIPHPDARSASVGEYFGTDLVEHIEEAITLDGVSHLFRTWGDHVFRFGFEVLFRNLFGQRHGTRNIFVRGVGTATDQTHFNFCGPTVGGSNFFHFRDRGSQIWCEWAVQMGLQIR